MRRPPLRVKTRWQGWLRGDSGWVVGNQKQPPLGGRVGQRRTQPPGNLRATQIDRFLSWDIPPDTSWHTFKLGFAKNRLLQPEHVLWWEGRRRYLLGGVFWGDARTA